MKIKNKTKHPPRLLLSKEPSPVYLVPNFEEILRYPLVKGKSRQLNLRIPEPLHVIIQKEAGIRSLSLSDFARECIILFTVPGSLINTAKLSPEVKLNPREIEVLREYKELLQGLLDDLKLVVHLLGNAKLPRPEVLDMNWIEKVLETKVNKAIHDYRKATEKQKQEGKKPK